MDVQVAEWLSLIVRWLHVIFGVTWIGTSFYFNWLNNQVRDEGGLDERMAGDLWSIHGGRFYRVVKYKDAPEKLPKTLHWFKYEAYFTWISGFTLLILVYYLEPSNYLVDSHTLHITALDRIGFTVGMQAVAISVLSLIIGWVLYDLACRSPLKRWPIVLAILGLLFFVSVAHGYVEYFGARAAYMHVGALIGTIMAWNVFFVIIPNQKKTVAALVAGKEPDPKWGNDGAQRSLHNNYFTLPVLFIMVSNHYPMTYGHQWNWAILTAISVIGAAVRHWFNLRGQGKRNVWILPVASLAMIGLAIVSAPRRAPVYEGPVSFDDVRTIVEHRCQPCHSSQPTFRLPGQTELLYPSAPQGVMFDSPQEIVARAARIHTMVVTTQQMPLSNFTEMTDEERSKIAAWYERGHPGP